jgi:hypothetical protein
MVKSRKTKRGGVLGEMNRDQVSILALMQREIMTRYTRIKGGLLEQVFDGSYGFKSPYNTRYRFLLDFQGNPAIIRNFIVMLLVYTVRAFNPAITDPKIRRYVNSDILTPSEVIRSYPITAPLAENMRTNTTALIKIIDKTLVDYNVQTSEFLRWFEIRIHAMLLSIIGKMWQADKTATDDREKQTSLSIIVAKGVSIKENDDLTNFFGDLSFLTNYTVDNRDDAKEKYANERVKIALDVLAGIINMKFKSIINGPLNETTYAAFVELFDTCIRPAMLDPDEYNVYPSYPTSLFSIINSTGNTYASPIAVIECKSDNGNFKFVNMSELETKQPDKYKNDIRFFEKLIQTINAYTLSIGNDEPLGIGYEEPLYSGESSTRFPQTSLLGKAEKGFKNAYYNGPSQVYNNAKECVGAACRKYDTIVQKNPKLASAALLATGAAAGVAAKDYFGFGGAKSRKRRKSKTRKRTKTKKPLPKTNRRRRKSRL